MELNDSNNVCFSDSYLTETEDEIEKIIRLRNSLKEWAIQFNISQLALKNLIRF